MGQREREKRILDFLKKVLFVKTPPVPISESLIEKPEVTIYMECMSCSRGKFTFKGKVVDLVNMDTETIEAAKRLALTHQQEFAGIQSLPSRTQKGYSDCFFNMRHDIFRCTYNETYNFLLQPEIRLPYRPIIAPKEPGNN